MSIDWSDISKLRFREYEGKIIEVLVPKNEKSLSRKYPVMVLYENYGGQIFTDNYALDGVFNRDEDESIMDIIQIREEPFSFLEIVELIAKRAKFRDVNILGSRTIIRLDLDDQEFTSVDCNGRHFLNSLNYFIDNVEYSLDGTNYSKLYKETK